MAAMKHISCIESTDNVCALVRQDLREIGIKVPKNKKSKRHSISKNNQDLDGRNNGIFGNYLSLVPCVHIQECGYVPKFLVDAAEVITDNIEQEGLFRKSGAVSRQKQLKVQVEQGNGMKDSNVYDVTALIKQFFRKLPEPLFTSMYHDSFIKCFQLGKTDQSTHAVLLLCLLLPGEHLSTLRFMMLLLLEVANHSKQNKMDPMNLAVVLAPNLMHINSKSEKMNSSEEKLLQFQTSVVELLIRNAELIGMVSLNLCERAALMTEVFGTDDELDASCETLEESHNCKKKEKRRKRSGSFQGIISTIAQSVTKWRKSTDGKSANHSTASNMSTMSQYSNMSQYSCKHNQSSDHDITQQSVASMSNSMATPVVMRKRKASGEMPFSASKKKAILQNLPNGVMLANTPYTPASGLKKLDINEIKKAGTLNTPSIAFSNKDKVAFSATPCQGGKNMRKRLGLFSPANTRKGRKLSSSSISMQASGKKGKSKGLFRRFSGGKGDKPLLEPAKSAVQQSSNVGQRLASPTGTPPLLEDSEIVNTPEKHGVSDSSPIAAILNQSNSSPPVVEHSMLSVCPMEQSILSVCDDRNSLNEGFIVPDDLDDDDDEDESKAVDSTIAHGDSSDVSDSTGEDRVTNKEVRASVSDSAVHMYKSSSDSGVSQQHRSFTTDPCNSKRAKMLRRGRPNSLKAGLLSGEPRKVLKLRRSFGLDKSEISEPIPVSLPASLLHLETSSVSDENESHVTSSISSNNEDVKSDSEGSNSESKPENCAERITETLVKNDSESNGMSDESEISVSVNQEEKATSDPQTTSSNEVSNSDTRKEHKLIPCDSTDSLLSGQRSMEVSPEAERKAMSRSLSTDSGKGSMFDESGIVESKSNILVKSYQEEGKEKMDAQIPTTEDCQNESKGEVKAVAKSTSTQNLQRSMRPNVSRSQSLYEPSSRKQPNITPNLQISTETHNLLSRAGYLSDKGKKNANDDFQVMGPPPPRIKHAEIHKPKRESILELKVKNAGRVLENVKQFENIGVLPDEKHADIIERHNSPFRFPNSVSRKRGCSPVRIPSVFSKKNSDAGNKRDLVQIGAKLGKGQARLPISTQLIKPSEKAANVEENEEMGKVKVGGNKVKRKPSIYYAKEDSHLRKPVSKAESKSENGGNSLLGKEENSLERSELEFMETSDMKLSDTVFLPNKENEVEMNVEDCSTIENRDKTCAFEEAKLNESLVDTINSVCTPRKEIFSFDFAENRNLSSESNDSQVFTPKMPAILKPLGDSIILRTASGMTPRSVIKRSNTTCSPRSPIKAVKRLGSPGSPCRNVTRHHSMSPRRNKQKISLPSSIPQHLQEEMSGM